LIVSTLILFPYALKAQEHTPKEAAQPKSNQVYVKIVMPNDPPGCDQHRPVVEAWIAEDLKKLGQAKFTAVTASLMDEPGSRAIAGVKEQKTEKGMPYVAVLIGPPPEDPAAATDRKK
jgi:hypothetical protein